MAQQSHIELDGRPYNIVTTNYRKTVANPMAAKTGQGTSSLQDQQNWDYFVQETWNGGIGQSEESTTGAWFIVGDARHSGQVSLASTLTAHRAGDSEQVYPRENSTPRGGVTIGDEAGSDYEKISLHFNDDPTNIQYGVVHLLVQTPSADVTVELNIYEATSTSDTTPSGASLYSENFTIYAHNIPGYQYVCFPVTFTAVGTTATVITLETTTQFTLAHSTVNGGDHDEFYTYYNGASWVTSGAQSPCASVKSYYDEDYITGYWLYHHNSKTYPYWYGAGGKLYYGLDNHDGAGDAYTPSGVTADATDATMDDAFVYMAYGSSHTARQLAANTGLETDLTVNATRIEIGGGYLWRSYQRSIFYSSDKTTWTEIETGENIIDIEHYNGSLHYITRSGLYYIGSGDVVIRITRASFADDAEFLNWQGRLYIRNIKDLMEYDGSSIRDISLLTSGGLPEKMDGDITALWGTNLYLYAGISATNDDGGYSGLYAYNGQGWCCLFLFGNDCTINSIYMRANPTYTAGPYQDLWVNTDVGIYYVQTHEYKQTPSKLFTTVYAHYSRPFWVETPWIYGGLKTLVKDWESVTLAIDRAIDTQSADWSTTVYYKVDEGDSWTQLGTDTYEDEDVIVEHRWSNLTTRPASKKMKIGILHQPLDWDYTDQNVPRLRTMSIKYHAMLRDRWQWSINVPASDAPMASGRSNPYSKAEQETHLDGLIQQDGPFILRDITGAQYEVKVLAGFSQPTKIEWVDNSLSYVLMYSLTLDQVTTEEYSG